MEASWEDETRWGGGKGAHTANSLSDAATTSRGYTKGKIMRGRQREKLGEQVREEGGLWEMRSAEEADREMLLLLPLVHEWKPHGPRTL